MTATTERSSLAKPYEPTYEAAVVTARFRANLIGYRYRVSYDPANERWNVKKTDQPLGNRQRSSTHSPARTGWFVRVWSIALRRNPK